MATGRGSDAVSGVRSEAHGDRLRNIEHLTGSAHADTLTGDAGANLLAGSGGNDVLTGGGGNDTLEGGAGADTLDGGTGTGDTASYAGSAAGVNVNLATGRGSDAVNGARSEAHGDTLQNIENLTGSAHADTLTGNAVANVLNGGDGADTLRGGGGRDTLVGGAGNDTLYGGGDSDELEGGVGADKLYGAGNGVAVYTNSEEGVTIDLTNSRSTNGASWGTGSGGEAAGDRLYNIHHVRGSAQADTLTGNNDANNMYGGDGADTLDGRGANDGLYGGFGADTLNGGHGSDTLRGEGDADTLDGEEGNDILIGGAGADELEGGSGGDRFVFYEASDSTVGARDVILDFRDGSSDQHLEKLDFSQLGTDLRVRYQKFDETGTENDKTIVQVDLNKDGDIEAGEDFELELTGLHDLSANDFNLFGDNASVVEVTDIVVA